MSYADEIFIADLQSVINIVSVFLTKYLQKPNLCVPLQPANEEEKRSWKREKGERKEIKNKVCKREKGCYLCSPQTRERKESRKREKANKKIKNKVCKNKKGSYLCSPKRKGQKNKRTGSDFRGQK